MNAAVGGNKLLNVHDELSDLTFLVDTGAEVSLIPPTPAQRRRTPNKNTLYAANGVPIDCFGTRSINIRLRGRQYRWSFHIADVTRPLLGADFLGEFGLVPDLRRKALIDLTDLNIIQGRLVAAIVPRFTSTITNIFTRLLDDRPKLTELIFDAHAPHHGVFHHIPTDGPPVFARARRLAPEKLSAARREFKELEQLGIVRKSNSPWASPLHVVNKPGGGFRMCGDYRHLNAITRDDRYPIKHITDFNEVTINNLF